jgi:hypothetical protein
MRSASWVIVDRETGRAVCEIWRESVAAKVNAARYEAVPVLDWLYRVNAAAKGEGN